MRKLSLKELGRPSVEEFKAQAKAPICLVLDNLRSALNVGSAFRTADGFAVEKVYLCGITASPPHREILKTAIGATEAVEWAYEKDTASLLRRLRTEGYQVMAVEQTTESVWLQDVKVDKNSKYALVFGNEVGGISEEALQEADGSIEVPQYGTKHSFNISVCIGIVLWEFYRQFHR